jgi:hypothetical protein
VDWHVQAQLLLLFELLSLSHWLHRRHCWLVIGLSLGC